jgi:DNA-binding response OmpR family regulator
MRTAKIAVIEDEPTIAGAVASRLRKEGFEVEQASDGPSGVELCRRMDPDIVILDVMLPGFDGLEVCRRIQTARAIPVIMLTALDDETDKLIGFGVGADDYVTKPFSARELVARVKALLRRIERNDRVQDPIHAGDLLVDPRRRCVSVGAEEVHLTPIEFELIRTLVASPGTVYTREMLMEQIWGHPDTLGSRTVDSHVRSLRRKLGPQRIRTVHGVGYAFAEETV